MSVVFSQDRLGSSVGYAVSGATPISKLEFGTDGDFPWTGDGFSQAVRRYIRNPLRNAANAGIEYWNDLYKLGKLTYAEAAGYASDENANRVMNEQGVTDLIKTPVVYANSELGAYISGDPEVLRRTFSAKLPLTDLIKPLGLVVGVSLAFEESAPPSSNGLVVDAGTKFQLYRGSISGICFHGACDTPSQFHGLEPVLEYYYHHRVSNLSKDLIKTTLKIGSTTLKAWVVSLNVEPLNLDYKIWAWSIGLLISPDYDPPMTYGGPVV